MAETTASAAAMLDRETERKLYQTFRRFFVHAERERRWDLWNDILWDQARSHASETLVEAVVATLAASELHSVELLVRAAPAERGSRVRPV